MEEKRVEKGVQEIQLDSWRDFLELSNKHFTGAPAYIYRGQANYDWPLVSTLARLRKRYPKRKSFMPGREYLDEAPLSEEGHLRAFRHAIAGRRGEHPASLTPDECWALGQQHGLATPLLDWTCSPFVALFFAFEEEKCFVKSDTLSEPEYRGVYALSTNVFELVREADSSDVRLLWPENEPSYRLIAQDALFTRMLEDKDIEGFVRSKYRDETRFAFFIKVSIRNQDRNECLVALKKMNINYKTLFPDLEGAARHVNSLWQPGHEELSAYE